MEIIYKNDVDDIERLKSEIIQFVKENTSVSKYKKGVIQKKLFSHFKNKRYTNDQIDDALEQLVNDQDNWNVEFENRDRAREEIVPISHIGDPEKSDVYMVKIARGWIGAPFGSRYWFLGNKYREDESTHVKFQFKEPLKIEIRVDELEK